MITDALLWELAALIRRSFGAAEVFSCLTGSAAAENDTDRSDIDVVVVLPDSLPLPVARAGRERFTRAYIDLHTRHGRAPDLDWPGEILFARDLDAACRGAAFDLSHPGIELPLCPEEISYRYWVSMTASGLAITGTTAFAAAATRCADVMARHVLFRMCRVDSEPPDVSTVLAHPAWDTEWQLPQTPLCPAWPRLDERAGQLLNFRKKTLGSYLAQWAHVLRESPQPPALDTETHQWRGIAYDRACSA